MKKLIFTIILSCSFSALAMYGPTETAVDESVCQIIVTSLEGVIKSISTGTLISANQVAVSGTSVAKLIDAPELVMTVKCGYKKIESSLLEIKNTEKGTPFYVSGVEYSESHIVKEAFLHVDFASEESRHNQGVVTLEDHSSLKPVELANPDFVQTRGEQSELANIQIFSNCTVSGSGVNSENRAGIPVSAKIKKVSFGSNTLKYSVDVKLDAQTDSPVLMGKLKEAAAQENSVRSLGRFLVDEKRMDVMLDAGDAGGSLVCSVQGQPQLVGILAGYQMGVNGKGVKFATYWAPYNLNKITQKIR